MAYIWENKFRGSMEVFTAMRDHYVGTNASGIWPIMPPEWDTIKDLQPMSITICISNWNQSCHTERIIDKQLSENIDNLEIIYVDHCSDEPQEEIRERLRNVMRKHPCIDLKYFECEKNMTRNCGFPLNVAAKRAKNEVVLLNPTDVLFDTDNYLEIVGKTHRWKDRIFLSGPMRHPEHEEVELQMIKDLGGSIRKEHFCAVKGFSENRKGWGGIEGNMFERMRKELKTEHVVNTDLRFVHLHFPDGFQDKRADIEGIQNGGTNRDDWGDSGVVREVKL